MKTQALPWIGFKMPRYGAIQPLVVVAYLACITQPTSAASLQTGFISIDCGSSFAYTDQVTGINWVPDTNFTSLGTNVVNVPGSAKWSNNSELTTLRTFKELTRAKYCYELPGTTPNATYLIRHTYWYGSYDGAPTTLIFYVYIDATLALEIDLSDTEDIIYYHQHTYKALSDTISFCLMRHPLSGADPFISSLEVRPILAGTYDYSFLNGGLLVSVHRNYGGNQVIRFPEDEYDRIWKPIAQVELVNVSSDHLIGNVNEMPLRIPSAVLQTGQTSPTVKQVNVSFPFYPSTEPVPAMLELFFAELNQSSTSRTFTINAEGSGPMVENTVIKTGGPWQAHGVVFENWSYRGSGSVISLIPAVEAMNAPLINALSLHFKLDTKQALTYGPDVVGLQQVKSALNLTSWNGDPCLPVPHAWILYSVDSPPRIIAVNLSRYNLIGEILADINKLTALITLAFDNNALTGQVPELTTLTSLQKLHLQGNKLSGSIPPSLGLIPTLQELYLQNNFTGSVPTSLKRNGLTVDVTGNPGLSDNNVITGPVPAPSSTKSGSSSDKSNVGLMAGVVGGSVAGFLVVGCVFSVFSLWKNRNKDSTLSFSEPFVNCSPTTTKSSWPVTEVLHEPNNVGTVPQILDQGTLLYTLQEVKVATNNYSRKIGQGGFGSVYYGKLPNGFEVAIKVCNALSLPEGVEFNIEVEVLSRAHHRNLVHLIGYCKEKNSQILIYEFLHKGTVQEHLYGSETAIKHPLDWKLRLNIALDAAQGELNKTTYPSKAAFGKFFELHRVMHAGLEYLHVGCTPNMIHRDIKSCNILLTDKYVAKVADFGLCKSRPANGDTHVSTLAKGTFGYLDPEYFETHMLTAKSDVYSFGVFLLELMSARKPIDNFATDGARCNITQWARELMNTGDIETLVGSCIAMSNPNMSSVWKVVELAMKCVEKNPKQWPCMSDVVRELREAIAIESAHSGYDSSYSQLNERKDHPKTSNKHPQNPRLSGAPHSHSSSSQWESGMLRPQVR